MKYEYPSVTILTLPAEDILNLSEDKSFKGLGEDGKGTGEHVDFDKYIK